MNVSSLIITMSVLLPLMSDMNVSSQLMDEILQFKNILRGNVFVLAGTERESIIANNMNFIDGVYDASKWYLHLDHFCTDITKNPMEDTCVLQNFVIYIDNNVEYINKAKNGIFWTYYCENGLVPGKISKIANEYFNTIDLMRSIVELPGDVYVNHEYVKNFIYYLRHTNVRENINPICCDDEYIRYCVNIINVFGKSKGIEIPYQWVIDKDTLNIIEYYFLAIREHTSNGGKLYSLGDSLDKFNYVWNINQEQMIVSVPFSGSMYYNIPNSSKIVLDKNLEKLMYSSVRNLYEHNNGFKELFNDIAIGNHILITDYGHSGKALITITKLINYLAQLISIEISWNNVEYLQITPSMKIIQENIKEHLWNEPQPSVIYYNRYLDSYFTNSDRWTGGYNSRCVPRYEVNSWSESPEHIWKNGLIDNYKLCNIHRVLLLFQLCCHYTRILNTLQ
jgi:hypothetical protein